MRRELIALLACPGKSQAKITFDGCLAEGGCGSSRSLEVEEGASGEGNHYFLVSQTTLEVSEVIP